MNQRSPSALLQEWCDRLAEGDVDGGLALLDDGVVVLAPFVPDPIPKRMDGREAFAAAFRPVGALFSVFTWTALEIHACAEEGLAFGLGSAEITLADGRPYSQDYVMVVRAAAGLIIEYREYMDPIRAQAALAGFTPPA